MKDQEIKFQEFSVKEYIFIIRLHLKKILFFTIIGFCIGFYYTLVTPPYHLATSSVLLKENPGAGMVMDLTGNRNQDNISNAIQMIRSRIIAKETVKSLWPRYKNNLDLFGSYPFYPRGRRIRKYFKELISFGGNSNPEKRAFHTEKYTDEIGNLYANKIQKQLRVEHINNTDIIKISYGSVWAAEAQLITNTLTKVYKKFEKEINAEEAINAVTFIEDLVKEQMVLLSEAEKSLADFQSQEQIYDQNAQSSLLTSRIIELENKILENKIQINVGLERAKYFKSLLIEQESEISEKIKNTQNIQIQSLRTSISRLEGELLINTAQYGEKHSAVTELEKRIKVLKDQLESKINELISKGIDIDDPLVSRQNLISEIVQIELDENLLKFDIKESQDLIIKLKEKLDALPLKKLEYLKLERTREVMTKNYTEFTSRLENAKLNVASLVGKVQILDLASLPNRNLNDNKRNILIGILFGLAAGFGLAFIIEFFDSSVKTLYDIEKHNLSVLGVIPAMNEKKIKPNSIIGSFLQKNTVKNGSIERQLITLDSPKSPIAEAYRSLRTTLLYSSTKSEVKSLIVSSAGPGDGKTTTVANLAITLANMGKKTILIDTDLRRPVVNKVFNIDKSPGVTDYLAGYIDDFSKVIVKSSIENLYVVPSGVVPPNPSELLGSKRLSELIKKLENEWDMVLFDSPPLVAVTDATMISKEIDKIIIVVKVGQTENSAFEHTINALKNVSAPIGGIILNAVTESHNYGYYYYYYQYYNYYGQDKPD